MSDEEKGVRVELVYTGSITYARQYDVKRIRDEVANNGPAYRKLRRGLEQMEARLEEYIAREEEETDKKAG